MRHFLFLSLLFLTACVSVDSTEVRSTWTLAYAHDENGQAVSGSKSDLIQAINGGKEIRVHFGSGRVIHLADAAFITVFDGEVFTQVEPIQSQSLVQATDDYPTHFTFRESRAKWRASIGTNGSFVALMDGQEPIKRKRGAKWFVSP